MSNMFLFLFYWTFNSEFFNVMFKEKSREGTTPENLEFADFSVSNTSLGEKKSIKQQMRDFMLASKYMQFLN